MVVRGANRPYRAQALKLHKMAIIVCHTQSYLKHCNFLAIIYIKFGRIVHDSPVLCTYINLYGYSESFSSYVLCVSIFLPIGWNAHSALCLSEKKDDFKHSKMRERFQKGEM